MKFRKKPVVIEAVHWTGGWDNYEEICAFIGNRPDYNMNGESTPQELLIETLEGELYALLGDWIIKGIKGEFYPCKPDIFEATYEAVE